MPILRATAQLAVAFHYTGLSCGVTLQRSEAMYSYSGRCCMIVYYVWSSLKFYHMLAFLSGLRLESASLGIRLQSFYLAVYVANFASGMIQALREAVLVNVTTLNNCPHNNMKITAQNSSLIWTLDQLWTAFAIKSCSCVEISNKYCLVNSGWIL